MYLLNRKEKAYAKINLHLEVLNKRADGFHNIFSLMTQVDFFDILKLEESIIDFSGKSPVSVDIINNGGLCGKIVESIPVEENLITKAVRLFCKEKEISGNFVFSLEKNIPAGAGLAGGSSDAAAAIRLLNAEAALPKEKLLNVARATGSDVPFLLEGGCAICEGTGDIMEFMDSHLNFSVVLAMKEIHINTGKAYSLLDRTENFVKDGRDSDLLKRQIKSFVKKSDFQDVSFLANDFEPIIYQQHPVLADIKKKIQKSGSVFSLMSGSGSTIIGLFADEKKAEEAVKCLKSDVESAIIAHFISSRNGFL